MKTCKMFALVIDDKCCSVRPRRDQAVGLRNFAGVGRIARVEIREIKPKKKGGKPNGKRS